MKSLKTIQTLSKIGKIMSKVIGIICIVAACLCAVGIVSLALGLESFKIGGVTIHSIIEEKAEISMGTMYAAMGAGILLCVGEAILCRFAEKYFANELKAGTPFTMDGAKELLRLGILAICIPIASEIAAGIVFGILKLLLDNVEAMRGYSGPSIGLGVMMIFTSVICRYGAELNEAKPTSETPVQ